MTPNVAARLRVVEPAAALVVASKGLELGHCLRMTEVAEAEAGNGRRVLALSGPNIAAELMAGKPATSVVARTDASVARRVPARLGTRA